jgi:methylphosphotriester-DNA--protein-cysteine methyltransferase
MAGQMSRHYKRSEEQIAQALKENTGNITNTRKQLGYNNNSQLVYRIKKSEKLQAIYNSFTEEQRKKPKTSPKKYIKGRSIADIKQALYRHGGVISLAAKDLGYSDSVGLNKRIQSSKDLQEYVSVCRRDTTELAESMLIDLIKDKDLNAIKFFLSHNSEKYSEKIVIDHNVKNESTWNLNILPVDQLLLLEQVAGKMLQLKGGDDGEEESENFVDGEFIEESTKYNSD